MQEVKLDKIPTSNNVKYTSGFVKKEFDGFLAILEKNKKNFSYISWQDLIEDKPYSAQRISEWVNDFPSNSEAKKKIDGILANKLSKFALANKVNATMAIFCLKCNHKWNDKIAEQENENPQKINISFGN